MVNFDVRNVRNSGVFSTFEISVADSSKLRNSSILTFKTSSETFKSRYSLQPPNPYQLWLCPFNMVCI